jgi:hypothetical protein
MTTLNPIEHKNMAAEMAFTNGHVQPLAMTAALRLRKLLNDRSDIIVAPGVYDGFSARIALEVGFDCIYMVSVGRS